MFNPLLVRQGYGGDMGWIGPLIERVTRWGEIGYNKIKRGKRRKDVQDFEKAVNSGDNDVVNAKLDKLSGKFKDRNDSR